MFFDILLFEAIVYIAILPGIYFAKKYNILIITDIIIPFFVILTASFLTNETNSLDEGIGIIIYSIIILIIEVYICLFTTFLIEKRNLLIHRIINYIVIIITPLLLWTFVTKF